MALRQPFDSLRPALCVALLLALCSGGCSKHTPLRETIDAGVMQPSAATDVDQADAAVPAADASTPSSALDRTTVAELSIGTVVGVRIGSTLEFLGIPYATPPVGALRFMPAQPIAAWHDAKISTRFGAACPQPATGFSSGSSGDEDCLYLNVYTPQHAAGALPVMVFIHGGAFMRGSADQFDGRALSEAGSVVVVTFNYRLGALGFLARPDLDAARGGVPSGNDGIRDQQLALRFVHDHIAVFGGDPSNVTVFGQSAGSVSTCIHALAPDSRTLAQRFIMQSGVCVGGGYGVWSRAATMSLGDQIGESLCPDAPDVLGCLRQQPVAALASWGSTNTVFGANWGPSVDGDGGVLPIAPAQLIDDASFQPKAVIVGTNKNEWGLYVQTDGLRVTSAEMLQSLLEHQFGASASRVEQQYRADDDAQANEVYVRLMTDILFRCPTRTLARVLSQHEADVYLYSFEQGTAIHSAELNNVFERDLFVLLGLKPPDPLTLIMQGYWTQFAESGTPNAGVQLDWPRYAADADQHLELTSQPELASGLSKADCDFWDDYLRDVGPIALGL